MSERQFGLPDGRQIGISGIGDPFAQRWTLFCHPAPGASGFDPDPLVTGSCSMHVISLDRPGYGSSDAWTVPPQPSPGRWVIEVQEFLKTCRSDAEAIGRVAYRDLAVLGWREGCVFAAALAAALGDEASVVAFVEPMTLKDASRSLAERDVWNARRLMPGITSGAPSGTSGLRSRVERMLETARQQGDAGLDADRAAMKQRVLDESLDAIEAETLILTRNTRRAKRSAHHYARHVSNSRVAVTDAPMPIAAHWSRLLAHLGS